MARMPNQKMKSLLLARIFEERTDSRHGLTLTEISAALREYNCSAERKSLYDDIELLRLCGYDIRTTRDTHVRYYLHSHTFEGAELKLLIDAVQSAKFLTPNKSNALIRKLEGLTSKQEAAQLHKQVDAGNRLKTENEEIYGNIAAILQAISQNRMIRCVYFEWNANKQKMLRHDGKKYLISPWALTWDDENYYLIAYDSDAGKIKHFRVDKMLKVRVTEEKREGSEAFEDFDVGLYSRHVFGMYGGEPVNVRILADNSLAGVVIDRFGVGTTVLNRGEQFEFCVKVMVSPTFFSWVLGFGGKMKILSPDSVAEEAAQIAREVVARYEEA